MSGTVKVSKPRSFSVTQEEYANRWDSIFARDLPKKDDYQDILSTEDCMIDGLENYEDSAESRRR